MFFSKIISATYSILLLLYSWIILGDLKFEILHVVSIGGCLAFLETQMTDRPVPKVLAGAVDYPDLNKCFNWRSTRPTINCESPGLFVEVS